MLSSEPPIERFPEVLKMLADKPREYFTRYMTSTDIMLNQHEIEKAILQVVGERNFDKEIKKIWDRVLKK
jgi:hypothetical protein